MSAPNDRDSALPPSLAEAVAAHDTSEEHVRHSFARLIAHSRLMRERAQLGDGTSILEILARRSALIRELETSMKQPVPTSFRPLLEQLIAEDAETGAALESWRERLKSELRELASSRQALDGYSRLAGSGQGSFERDL